MRLEIAVDVDAPRAVVWDVITDWERQSDWMIDAVSVEVVTPHRSGEAVTIRVPTRILGVVPVEDIMRVTGWDPGHRLEVVHLGRVIRGSGAFVLDDLPGGGTRLSWWEEIDPPFGAVGEWGANTLARPLLVLLFRRSLDNLRQHCEQEARDRV